MSSFGPASFSVRLAPPLAALALLGPGLAVMAQQAALPGSSTFQSGTTAVMVDVIVTDRKGRHIPGLSIDDFQVYEDNRPQTITSFAPPIGTTRGDTATGSIPTSALTPEAIKNGSAKATPQLVTLVIDIGDLHPDSLMRACVGASRFAERTIDEGNQIALYWVDTSLHLGTEFTANKERVRVVLEKLKTRTPYGRLTVRDREGLEGEIDSGGLADAHAISMLKTFLTTMNALQARTVFVALRAMSLAYRGIPGRKNVIVFSEGFLHAHDGAPEIQGVIDAANRAHVAIYVIDAAGLRMGTPTSGEGLPSEAPDRTAGGMDEFDWIQSLGTDARGDLGGIAKATGGFLVSNTNDLNSALDKIESDISEFYTLVYTPSNRVYDSAFRKIRVELVPRGYQARYRRGYWALPPGRELMMTPAAAQMLAAVSSGGRKPSFAPRLNAVLVPDLRGTFGICAAVSMPGNLIRFERVQNEYVGGVNLLLVARDSSGQVIGVNERYGEIRVGPKEHKEFASKSFNWQGRIPLTELQPVHVQAIVRLSDGSIGVGEQRRIDLAGNASSLRLTSLVLSNREQNSSCKQSSTDPLCVQGVQILLPATPEFTRSTTLLAYVTVLGLSLNDSQKPDLGISFRLRSQDILTAIHPKDFVAVPSSIPKAVGVLADFDLLKLRPGNYQLEVITRDKINQSNAIGRADLVVQ